MSHTQCKLTVSESSIYANEYHLMANGNWLMAIQHNGEQMPDTQRENARRLAACWNACDKIETDALELAVNTGIRELWLKLERHDKLLAALQAILPFIPTTSAVEGGAAMYSEAVKAADKVRAAIAATETDSNPPKTNEG